jgi:hypothetical protein
MVVPYFTLTSIRNENAAFFEWNNRQQEIIN